ncbi:MAG: polyphosphate polymerase domain-containing protein [Planctomycetota bacterium]|nr:MAG: polyphosphate polymerase domain-containing protein [Planctomycetota bacterium]
MRLTLDLSRARVETKYCVADDDVPALLARIPADEREEYGIRSLYFDRPDGSLARAAVADPLRCTKVRAREYPGDSAVWFEVKTRRGRWTRKSRIHLHRSEAAALFGGCPVAGVPPGGGEEEHEARRYLQDVVGGSLVPIGVVRSFRQTFVLKRPPMRITLDREIAYFRPETHPFSPDGSERPSLLLRREAAPVLEVKHAGQLAPWLEEIVSGLRPSTYSKFRNLVRFLAEAGRTTRRVDRF